MSDESQPVKKAKATKIKLPSSLIINFLSQDNESPSSPLDIPLGTNLGQLEDLLNSLINGDNDEDDDKKKTKIPYAFYINGFEVKNSLEETLELILKDIEEKEKETASSSISKLLEETLTISYQPLSVYRVRPLTRCISTIPGHTDSILHLSYSPNGKHLASGGGDKTVRFWNVNTNLPLFVCEGHSHHILYTGWTPNNKVFVSADRSGEIRLWNPTNGKLIGAPLRGHKKWVTSLTFEPLHRDVECSRMASSSKDNTIRIWNLHTGTCECIISGHNDSVECVKWGGSGLIYSASRDRTIKVWEIDGHGRSQYKLIRTLSGHAHRINFLALNCEYVFRTGIFDFNNKLMDKNFDYESLSPEEVKKIALERYHNVIGQDGERLVSCSDDFTLFIWKPEEDKQPILRMTGHQQLVNHISYSPDGRFLASASFDKKVKLWCGKTGRFLSTLTGHVGSVYQVTWSPDSTYLVSGSKDSTCKVWSVKDTKKALYTLPGHFDEVYTLDWSPNGTQLASGSKDRTIKIWHH